MIREDGRTWRHTGRMTPAQAMHSALNVNPFHAVAFPAMETIPTAYKGDGFGPGVTFDWDFYHRTWTFYPLSWSHDDLSDLLLHFFHEGGFVEMFNIPLDNLRRLIQSVRDQMHANPYHNFEHICDVTQACFCFCQSPTALGNLPETHRLAVLLAAMTHDLDHPGVTNLFLKNDNDILVARYGVEGTLEHHHVHLALELFAGDTDPLVNMLADARKEVLRLVEKCILATDMSRHKKIVDDVEALMPADFEDVVEVYKQERETTKLSMSPSPRKKPRASSSPVRLGNSGKVDGAAPPRFFDRRRSSIEGLIASGQVEAVLLLFIKAADLSNVARPAHANERWVSRIYTEFHAQGEREAAKGFPVSPGMGPGESVAKGQVFFGSVICRPLFVMLAGVIPESGTYLDALDDNLNRWKAVAAAEDEAARAASAARE